jgi:hypothetical protein
MTPGLFGAQAFKRGLAQNPKRLFHRRALNDAERARLDQFSTSGYGASVAKLKPMAGRSLSDIKADLAANGFKVVPPSTPNMRKPRDMEIFVHKDGGLVKIKPNGDDVQFTRFGREGPMVSKEVVIDPAKSGDALTSFDNVAFKVTETGLPIPKLSSQLYHPLKVSRNDAAKKAFDKAWGDNGHQRPAAPPDFAQRISND